MRGCSVVRNLRIEGGGIEDYRKLCRFHYRNKSPGAYTAIFVLKFGKGINREPVGVIVYSMPSAGSELRSAATGNIFAGFDNRTRLGLINKNIRCISRVIIEPRFRGLGLASRLVQETMQEMDIPIIEAMAVMGLVNPFFEKAGMKAYRGNIQERCVRLMEAFSLVGIEKDELIDAEVVQGKIEQLGRREGEFMELQINRFLQGYGQRRFEAAGLERTRLVLGKLTYRPIYYIWFNEKVGIRV